ncbi:MAG: flavodoxin family protein [Candidatus Brockarchaeota archaeon]|nr:flavodoxin family protein [Candidatus Brockarchaeota archaeon]
MASMKFLGIVCSPRVKGNTALLVEAVLDGARKRGAETDIFYCGSLKINPCLACNKCETLGRCAQGDDMQGIYDSMRGTDVIAFGTPIYHDHVSAQAKAVTDRLYAYEWKDSFPKGAKAVIIITYEWDNPSGYDGVLEWIKGTFERYYGVETVATLKACNTTKMPVARRPDLLREAEDLGSKLALGLRKAGSAETR